MGYLPGKDVRGGARDVSADGTVVVGWSDPGPVDGGLVAGSEAFRWTRETGLEGLGLLDGSDRSSARAISADGSVIVGASPFSPNSEVFRWTEATGTIDLGDLPGGEVDGRARGISADGSVVVGWSDLGRTVLGAPLEAFRWTQATGMVGLGSLFVDRGSVAVDTSADGSSCTSPSSLAAESDATDAGRKPRNSHRSLSPRLACAANSGRFVLVHSS